MIKDKERNRFLENRRIATEGNQANQEDRSDF
jgi:hypothetical protein